MPNGFQSPFKQLGTQLQAFKPTQAGPSTPSAKPTGYGTATGLYGSKGAAPAQKAAPQYAQFTRGLFESDPFVAASPLQTGTPQEILRSTVGVPEPVRLERSRTAMMGSEIMGRMNAGETDMQGAVNELVSAGVITQGQADTALNDYNAALSSHNQQAIQAQQAFDVERGKTRRGILQKARLGEQDIFQYGGGDVFDQAVEAAYRGL